MRNEHWNLAVQTSEKMWKLEILRYRWEETIKIDFKDVRLEGGKSLCGWCRDKYGAVLNMRFML
jgi:predicted 3-demethylubiquinone-9 3-methyltransferase (glyoxalase superfamily)